jgi:AICAR transformylase/IMP cyclohydrolase PurH
VDFRYGINPQQAAYATPVFPDRSPVRVRNGSPSYINMLDALNGWQLVLEAARALRRPGHGRALRHRP